MAGFLIPFGRTIGEMGAGFGQGENIQQKAFDERQQAIDQHLQVQQQLREQQAKFQQYQRQQADLPNALKMLFGPQGASLMSLGDPGIKMAVQQYMDQLGRKREADGIRSYAAQVRASGDVDRANKLEAQASLVEAGSPTGVAGQETGVVSDPLKSLNEWLAGAAKQEAIRKQQEEALQRWQNAKQKSDLGLGPDPGPAPVVSDLPPMPPAPSGGGVPTGGGGGGAGISPEISSMISSVAASSGVPEEILRSLVNVESGGNPNAVSPKGAIGLGQVKPGTGADMGYSVSDLYNPRKNLEATAKYLSEQYKRFHSWNAALAAFNAGPGRFASGRPLPAETRAYVPKVMAGTGAPAASATPTPPFKSKLPDMSRDAVIALKASPDKGIQAAATAELKHRHDDLDPKPPQQKFLDQMTASLQYAKDFEQQVPKLPKIDLWHMTDLAKRYRNLGGLGVPPEWQAYFTYLGAVYNAMWQAAQGTSSRGGQYLLQKINDHFPTGQQKFFPDLPSTALGKVRDILSDPNTSGLMKERDAILKKQFQAEHGKSALFLTPEEEEIINRHRE